MIRGSRIAPLALPDERYLRSMIIWTGNSPAGTRIDVDLSRDGGATWLACTNGGALPGFAPGEPLSGLDVLLRQTLATDDAAASPTLATLAVYVNTPAPGDAVNAVTLTSPTPGLNIGDLALYGEAGQEAIDCILTRIKPGPDLTAQLTLVDGAPAVHDADAGPVPPFTSVVTGTGRDCEAPPPPAITAVLGGYEDDGAHGPPADDGGLKLPSYKFQVGRG